MSLRVEIEKRLGNFALQAEFETREQTLALLGASGCGKSVTLKCIAGIMTPDKGRIELDGQVLFDAEKGSSSKMALGSPARIRASATRCCCPLESWAG